jgi:hypothetical protein
MANMSSRKGVILTKEQAIEIYKIKVELHGQGNGLVRNWKSRSSSAAVSVSYKVSPKAIRDIWNHVTWKYATHPFWQSDSTNKKGNTEEVKLVKNMGADKNIEVQSFSFREDGDLCTFSRRDPPPLRALSVMYFVEWLSF